MYKPDRVLRAASDDSHISVTSAQTQDAQRVCYNHDTILLQHMRHSLSKVTSADADVLRDSFNSLWLSAQDLKQVQMLDAAVTRSSGQQAAAQEGAPEERGLHNADGGSIPAILLCHWKDGNAHVDSVHVAQHEGDETKSNDCPPSFPSFACGADLQ